MNLFYLRLILPAILVVSGLTNATAQNKPNPITTPVPFLRVSADARSGAMGDVNVATSPDANSIFYNPGKTAFNSNRFGIAATYTPWLSELDLKSLYMASVAGFYKLNDNEAISLGMRYFSMGDLNFTDALGQDIKSFRPTDLALEAGYSRKLSDRFGMGLTVRYINSKLADNSTMSDYKSGISVAADLGFYYLLGDEWAFGAALTNLGSKISYGASAEKNYIPANLSIGAVYTETVNEDSKISLGLDLNKLLVPTPPDGSNPQAVSDYNNKGVVSSWFKSFGDAPGGFREELKEVQVGFGAEYGYKEQFFLRAGYFTESKSKGERNYVTAGVGLKYKTTGLNFSYLIPTQDDNNNALRNTLRLSAVFDLNK